MFLTRSADTGALDMDYSFLNDHQDQPLQVANEKTLEKKVARVLDNPAIRSDIHHFGCDWLQKISLELC